MGISEVKITQKRFCDTLFCDLLIVSNFMGVWAKKHFFLHAENSGNQRKSNQIYLPFIDTLLTGMVVFLPVEDSGTQRKSQTLNMWSLRGRPAII